MQIFTKLDCKNEQLHILGNVARIKESMGDKNGALKIHNEKLRLSTEYKDSYNMGVTYFDLAKMDRQSGDYESAVLKLQKSFKISIKDEHFDGIYHSGIMLAELLLKLKRIEEGYRVLQQAKEAEKRFEATNETSKLDDLLARYNEHAQLQSYPYIF